MAPRAHVWRQRPACCLSRQRHPQHSCVWHGIALLNEQTLSKAAAAAEVGQRTLYRWLRKPEFSRAYRQARREAFGQAIALTQRYAPLAVNTLAQVMMDDRAPTSSKVAAATTILRFGREGIELDDLAARVEALENAAPRREKAPRWR